jgi:hypothetical protein
LSQGDLCVYHGCTRCIRDGANDASVIVCAWPDTPINSIRAAAAAAALQSGNNA